MILRLKGTVAAFVITASLSLSVLAQDGRRRFQSFEAFAVPETEVNQAYLNSLTEESRLLTSLAKGKTQPNARADILSRLGEVYVLQDKANYFIAMPKFNTGMDLYMNGKSKVKPVEPKFNPIRSYRLFQNIIQTAPKYSRIDETLFQAGYYGQAVNDPEAVKYYLRLINEHKSSRFKLDSYMQVGEYYFFQRQFGKAIESFTAVLREPSKIANFALYKLSWCYYNQGQTRTATNLMQKVIENSKGIRNESELREESLRDLVVYYSDLGAIDEAQQYFVSIGEPEYGIKVLEKLSEIYFTQARYDKAIEALRRLIAARPFGEKTPNNHSKLIECYEKSQRVPSATQEMQVFISSYEKNSPWSKQVGSDEAKQYAYERSEVYARFTAKKYHEQSQQLAKVDPETSDKSLKTALFAYKRYLDMFSEHKNAYEMRFLFAELLFKQKMYEEAGREFEKVAKAKPKGPRLKDSLIGQIDSLTRLEEDYVKDLEAKGIKKKGKFDPIPLSTYATRLIEADETYIKSFPTDPRVADTQLHRAQVNYNYNIFEKAQKGFVLVIRDFPTTPASNTARHLTLDIHNINKDWEGLEKTAATYLQTPTFATAENKELLLKLIQGSIFQRAKDLEEKKKFAQAAETYMRLTTNYPNSEFADKAIFNASIDYINADQSEKAMTTSQTFLMKYPNSPLVPKMLVALASYFDDKLDYVHAATYYELLVEKDPKSPMAADALYNAGLYRDNLRHYDQALINYKKYLERYKGAKDAGEIFFSMGLIYEKMKRWNDAADTFKGFPYRYGSNKERVIESYFRLADILVKMKDKEGAKKSYQSTIFLNQKYNQNPSLGPNVGGKFAAKARFQLVQTELDDFNAIRFRMPQKVLARAIQDKALLLTRLKNRYLEIINYGDAETGVAALYHIGLIYQGFSEALFNAPVPKGLTPEEVQAYQQELQSRAAPIEEKAVEAYEKAVSKSIELEVYNEWSKKSYDRLTQFKPDRYPPLRGRIILKNWISEPLAPYSPGKGGNL